MAVIASGQITLSAVVDVAATYRYYLLQSSAKDKPPKPSSFPPPLPWDDVEPSYNKGSTNSLYTVDCTVFCDETYAYSEVSLSSSYEAAKAAYNEASLAKSEIKQLADNITLSVETKDGVASIKLKGATKESSGTIDLTGLVTFNDLKTSGKTTISGDNITTGKITAVDIEGVNINGCKIMSEGTTADGHLTYTRMQDSTFWNTYYYGESASFGETYFTTSIMDGIISCFAGNSNGSKKYANVDIDSQGMKISTIDMTTMESKERFKIAAYHDREYVNLISQGSLDITGSPITLNGTDVLGVLEQIKDYTPLGGYDNTITDALNIEIYNDGYSTANRNTVFGSENASNELTNCPPYGSGAFYAYREVMRVKASTDPNKSTKIIVRLTETWPAPGRIWINVYDTNPATWLGWKDIYSWDKLVANGNTIEISSRGAIFVKPYDVSAGYFVFGNTGAAGGCAFRPASDNYNKIGESNYRFQRVYCTNGVTTSSDRRLKKNINEDFSTLEKIFSELTPVCYEYSYPDDGKMRMGLIAQDVEKILRKYGIDPDHFAVLQKDVIPADSEMAGIIGDTTVYSLNYEGLISLNMKMIQNLMRRVSKLEAITGGKNE